MDGILCPSNGKMYFKEPQPSIVPSRFPLFGLVQKLAFVIMLASLL